MFSMKREERHSTPGVALRSNDASLFVLRCMTGSTLWHRFQNPELCGLTSPTRRAASSSGSAMSSSPLVTSAASNLSVRGA